MNWNTSKTGQYCFELFRVVLRDFQNQGGRLQPQRCSRSKQLETIGCRRALMRRRLRHYAIQLSGSLADDGIKYHHRHKPSHHSGDPTLSDSLRRRRFCREYCTVRTPRRRYLGHHLRPDRAVPDILGRAFPFPQPFQW